MPLRTRFALRLRRALGQGSAALALAAIFAVAASTASAPAGILVRPRGAIGTRLEQCANRINGTTAATNNCTGTAWIRGDLNRNNSAYREGDFVPFRTVVTSLTPGTQYTLRISYDAVEAGLHAYDYLGTFNATVGPGQGPCDGVAGTGAPHCGVAPDTIAVPTDAQTTLPNGSHPPPSPAAFSTWGATLVRAAYAAPQTPIGVTPPASVERFVDVTFTASGPTAVLAWGGHIASSVDWGAGQTFESAHSGAPFHMRVVSINGASTGHQELSLHGDSLLPAPSIATAVDRSPANVGTAVVDTVTLGGRAGGPPVSGVVRFFVCSPPDASGCAVGTGTLLAPGPGNVVAAPSAGSVDGVASSQFVPSAAGRYCFRAEFIPSAESPYSPVAHTNTTSECFDAELGPPMLTLTKVCIPSTNTGLFNFLLNGAPVSTDVACGQTTGPHVAAVGANTVSETPGSNLSNLNGFTVTVGGNCTNVGPTSGTIAFTANGESRTCTITNQASGPAPASLTVTKQCSAPDPSARFELKIESSSPPTALSFPDVPCGGTTGAVTLAAGTYTVTEAGGQGTDLASYESPTFGLDCAPSGSLTLVSGQTAACTITNTRLPEPPTTLQIHKACVPGSDPGHFILTVNGTDRASVGCGDTTAALDVPAGTNTVGERGANGTDASDYDVEWGGACQVGGTVFVAPSQAPTACTITNVRRPPPTLLTVEKICVPSDDGGLFTLRIDGVGSVQQPCGGRLGPVAVAAGTHQVGEVAGNGTNLSDYTTTIGGNCAADGSVTVAAGQSATCTVTNVRRDENAATAQITIVKQCSPASITARFQFKLDGQVFQDVRCGDTTGPVAVAAGEHSIGEVSATAGIGDFRPIITGDCAANGSITLAAGQHATCTVTNVRQPVRPPVLPPAACYRLSVARRMVTVGNSVPILAHVHLHRRAIQGVRVYAAGHRVAAVRTTGPSGLALFVLRLRRPGILTLRISRPFGCPPPAPREIGILAARTSALSG